MLNPSRTSSQEGCVLAAPSLLVSRHFCTYLSTRFLVFLLNLLYIIYKKIYSVADLSSTLSCINTKPQVFLYFILAQFGQTFWEVLVSFISNRGLLAREVEPERLSWRRSRPL